jgi:hypothetical protein
MDESSTCICGYCGAEVVDGKCCCCQGKAGQVHPDVLNPMNFEPTGQGFRITFENGWSVYADKVNQSIPEKIKVQAFMPHGFPIKAYGREEFIMNCNDLAVILMQTSEISKEIQVSEEYATQSYEAMLEGLIFGVAA